MKTFFLASVAFIIACLATATATVRADEILAPKSSWEFTFTDPTADSTWNTSTGPGGLWSSGSAPFGNATGTTGGDFDWATFWPADGGDGDDLWVRKAVDFTGFDLSTVAWGLGVDNGYTLYANGTLISDSNAEGFTSRWEYTGGFGATLHPGVNVIAVALEDHGGLTAFDMHITGDPLVPEPATGIMLGSLLTSLLLRPRAKNA